MNLKKFISGISALSIAASAFAAMTITADADGNPEVLLNENFNSYTAGSAGNEWKAGLSAANGSRTYVAEGDNICFYHNANKNNALRLAQYELSSSGIALNTAPVTVSFKVKTTNIVSDRSESMAGSDYSLVGTDNNVIVSVAFTDEGIAYYTGGAASKADNAGDYGKNANLDKDILTFIENSTFSDNTWYDVEFVFDPTEKTVSLSVTDGTTSVASATINDITTSVALKYFHNSAGRLISTGKALTSTSTGGYVDDLYITKENVVVSTANVKFTGNATSITVGTETITDDGLDLVADTYSYLAKADGYISEYGTFTVTSDDTATGSKVVDVTLDAVPAAPANTNSKATKVSDNTSVVADGFRNTSVNVASGVDIWAGDTVTIEYDVFVTGGNSFNITLKSAANNGTGANIELVGGESTVAVRNQSSGSSNTTHGTFPANQWAHVALSFDAVNTTAETSPATDIRTENVRAVITAADGTVVNATGIAARNLAIGFSSGTRSYSFGGIDISGTGNIANAEIYVIGDHTVGPTSKFVAAAWAIPEGSDSSYTVDENETNKLSDSDDNSVYGYKTTLIGHADHDYEVKANLVSTEETGSKTGSAVALGAISGGGAVTFYLITDLPLNTTNSTVYCE